MILIKKQIIKFDWYLNLKYDNATAMGNYFFTQTNGNVVKVEYTFGYFLDSNQDLRINLHHSSLPYSN